MVGVTEDQLSHRIRQLAVFLPNRLGALLSLTRMLDAAEIRMRGMSILEAADHAVVRLVVDQPTLAKEILTAGGYSLVDSELLAVSMAANQGIRRVLTALIAGELNIHYMYSLLVPLKGRTVLALHVEQPEQAARALLEQGMLLVNQDDLRA